MQPLNPSGICHMVLLYQGLTGLIGGPSVARLVGFAIVGTTKQASELIYPVIS